MKNKKNTVFSGLLLSMLLLSSGASADLKDLEQDAAAELARRYKNVKDTYKASSVVKTAFSSEVFGVDATDNDSKKALSNLQDKLGDYFYVINRSILRDTSEQGLNLIVNRNNANTKIFINALKDLDSSIKAKDVAFLTELSALQLKKLDEALTQRARSSVLSMVEGIAGAKKSLSLDPMNYDSSLLNLPKNEDVPAKKSSANLKNIEEFTKEHANKVVKLAASLEDKAISEIEEECNIAKVDLVTIDELIQDLKEFATHGSLEDYNSVYEFNKDNHTRIVAIDTKIKAILGANPRADLKKLKELRGSFKSLKSSVEAQAKTAEEALLELNTPVLNKLTQEEKSLDDEIKKIEVLKKEIQQDFMANDDLFRIMMALPYPTDADANERMHEMKVFASTIINGKANIESIKSGMEEVGLGLERHKSNPTTFTLNQLKGLIRARHVNVDAQGPNTLVGNLNTGINMIPVADRAPLTADRDDIFARINTADLDASKAIVKDLKKLALKVESGVFKAIGTAVNAVMVNNVLKNFSNDTIVNTEVGENAVPAVDPVGIPGDPDYRFPVPARPRRTAALAEKATDRNQSNMDNLRSFIKAEMEKIKEAKKENTLINKRNDLMARKNTLRNNKEEEKGLKGRFDWIKLVSGN